MLDYKHRMNQKIKLIGITVILLALPLTIILAKRVQTYINRAAGPTYFAEYYVSPLGNDGNLGTEPDKPFKTIEKARDSVRSVKSGMTSDIVVYLRGGSYEIDQTINFTNQDSGANGHTIIYKNYQDEIPILSGGKQITGWVQDTQPGVFKTNLKAQLGDNFDSRQFYVNGIRAVRAREEISIPNAYIPPHTPGTEPSTQGFYTTDTGMQSWINKQNIEMVRIIRWRMYRCPLEDIVPSPDPKDITKQVSLIKVSKPCWNEANTRFNSLVGELGMGQSIIDNPTRQITPPYLENARELLDQPGEWYFDKTSAFFTTNQQPEKI